MKISILTLEGERRVFELEEVGSVFVDEDVIYFSCIPCCLSTASPVLDDLARDLVDFLESVGFASYQKHKRLIQDFVRTYKKGGK